MTDVIRQFEQLLESMGQALVVNDVQAVQTLTDQQQVCVSEIVAQAKSDEAVKETLKTRMPRLRELMTHNDILLQQGIQVSAALVQSLYLGTEGQQLQGSKRGYRA